MKLTYWVATCLKDSEAYNIRAKSKKECQDILKNSYNPEHFSEVHKVTVEYRDAFDLMMSCRSEGRYVE